MSDMLLLSSVGRAVGEVETSSMDHVNVFYVQLLPLYVRNHPSICLLVAVLHSLAT